MYLVTDFLAKPSELFCYGLAFYMGKGEAYFPWMHIDDVVSRHLFLLENGEATRVFNGCTSDHTTQKEIVTLFAKKAGISLVLPFPRLLMELY